MIRSLILPLSRPLAIGQTAWSGNSGQAFAEVAAFGDSHSQAEDSWAHSNLIGVGFQAVTYTAASPAADVSDISITHQNAGPSQSLLVSVVGTAVTVRLATDGASAITSTVAQVVAACNAEPAFTALNITASTAGTVQLAQSGGPVVLVPSGSSLIVGRLRWAQMFMRGRFDFPRNTTRSGAGPNPGRYNFGYSGFRADQLIGDPGPFRDLVNQTNPGTTLIVEQSGSNDVLQGANSATVIARRTAIWDALVALGYTIHAIEIPAVGNSGQQAVIDAANTSLAVEAASRKIGWTVLPSSLKNAGLASPAHYKADLIHFNPLGAQVAGSRLAADLDQKIKNPVMVFPASGSSQWKNTNPFVTGGPTVSTSWNAPTGPSGGTSAASKITVDGLEWQRMTVSQAGTYNLCQMTTSANVTPGSMVRVLGQFKVSGGFKCVQVQATFNGPGGVIVANRIYPSEITQMTTTLDPWEGVMVSPYDEVPAGATTATIAVMSYGAGTVDFRPCGMQQQI